MNRKSTILPSTGFVILLSFSINSAAYEIRSYDGTGNNLSYSIWGSAGSQLQRHGESHYSDGVSTPAGEDRPNPREISNTIAKQENSVENDRNLSSFVWQWGQFLDHDLDLTPSASIPEPLPIEVPLGDPDFDPYGTGTSTINFNRSEHAYGTGTGEHNPREHVNEITSWIDASNVYGSDAERAAELRSFSGGRLKTSEGDLLPFNVNEIANEGDGPHLFIAGDVRANEQAGLASMHTLFVREHNRLADIISSQDYTLSDEDIYQRARKIVGAVIQKITYDEFLPAVLGDDALGSYSGYDSSIDPTIKTEFSTAAFRFGHTMLPTELLRLDNDGNPIAEGNIALQDAFFDPEAVTSVGIDPYLKGLATQAAQELENLVVSDVRNFLFGPPGSGGLDLASLNIQRGRDHGLADYNQMRVDYGLDAVTDFHEITSDTELQMKLKALYGDVNEIDAWIGGLAEDHLFGASLGELFSTILIDQFDSLRHGDRFWYQNDDFFLDNKYLLAEIEGVTLGTIIKYNTNITNLQSNVFYIASVSEPASVYLLAFGVISLLSISSKRKTK